MPKTRTKVVAVYLTQDEKRRFQAFAKSQGRSLTSQMRISMEKDIKEHERSDLENE